MKRRGLWLLAWALLCCARPVSAQDPPPAARAPQLSAPLFWAEGITRVGELDAYARCGLNTVVVRVPWRPTPDGSFTPEDLEPVKAFAEAAAGRGLNIIYALPATPQGMEATLRASADGQAYFALWEAWTGGAMRALQNTPHLLGWMLPDDPRGLNYADDAAFARWIKANYANAQVLNAQWDAGFASLDAVTLQDAEALAARFRGEAPPESFTSDELNAAIAEGKRAPSPAVRNWAFHPAALVEAQFREDAWRALVSGWATRVRGFDPAHLLFGGRLPDYAQMLALPVGAAGVDVSVPDARPSVAERDVVSHNPQAVTVARRGGRLKAVAFLQSEGSDAIPAARLPALLPAWITAQMARGANGAAFSSWPAIARDATLSRAITQSLQTLGAPPFGDLWGQMPIATSALVLTPLADAYQVQVAGAPRGLYGFGTDLQAGEPGGLLWALRQGTAFGGVDVLAPEDVSLVSLGRYNTLLLPAALSLPDEEARALGRYATGGGVVVADLGAGALQNGGGVTGMSPTLRSLFGVAPSGAATQAFRGNLRLLNGHPLLPSFAGTEGAPGTLLTGGDGPNGAALGGMAAFFDLQGARPIALALQVAAPQNTLRAQMTANSVGAGFAVFAPFPLWNTWRPGNAGFDAFHGDLLNRGAALVLAGVRSFTPVTPLPGALPAYPEALNFPRAVGLLNHAANAQSCAVLTSGVGDFLWSDSISVLGGPSVAPLAEGRPAPLPNADAAPPDDPQRRAQPVTLYARPAGGELLLLRLRPIRAWNAAGGALCASIAREEARALQLTLWPNSTQVTNGVAGWQVEAESGGQTGTVRLQVFDAPGGYRVRPGSRHQILVTDLTSAPDKTGARPSRAFTATADAGGRLELEVTGRVLSVKVTPL